jgi:hypothetical protein
VTKAEKPCDLSLVYLTLILDACRISDFMFSVLFCIVPLFYFDLRFFSSRLFFSSTASLIHSDGLPTVFRYFSCSAVRRTP